MKADQSLLKDRNSFNAQILLISSQDVNIMIGVSTSKDKKEYYHNSPTAFCLNLKDGSFFIKGKSVANHDFNVYKTDRIGLKVDFEEKLIQFYHNEHPIFKPIKIADDITNLYPFIDFYDPINVRFIGE